jgi:TRAP-type uncharacterized transport system fused permease subunit
MTNSNSSSDPNVQRPDAFSVRVLTARIVTVIAIGLSLYQLYTAGFTTLTALVQRSIHLAAILTLTFLLFPIHRSLRKDRFNLWLVIDWLLAAAAIACTLYICVNLSAIFQRQGDWLPMDLVVSIVGTLLVLEACRRVIGWAMSIICVTALLYAYFGLYMPELIMHKGLQLRTHRHHFVVDDRGHFRIATGRGRHICLCIRVVWCDPGVDRGRQFFHRNGPRPDRPLLGRSRENSGRRIRIPGLDIGVRRR